MWMKTIVPLKQCPRRQHRINSPELTGCVITFVIWKKKLFFLSHPSFGGTEDQQHRVKSPRMISDGNLLLYEQMFVTFNILEIM